MLGHRTAAHFPLPPRSRVRTSTAASQIAAIHCAGDSSRRKPHSSRLLPPPSTPDLDTPPPVVARHAASASFSPPLRPAAIHRGQRQRQLWFLFTQKSFFLEERGGEFEPSTPPAMAVAGLLLRPPPCFIFIAASSPSPSSRQSSRSLMLPHPMTLPFVSGCSYRRRRTESKRRSRSTGVYASLFGVGAPEALVIGVVALLVFGPKGLAEVARNLGKTLRAFQPTIRELQDVSREFKSTLEREIGLDEVPPSTNYRPTTMNNSQQPAINTSSDDKPEVAPYTSEELMKVTEEQLAASAAAAWNTQEPPPSQQKEAADTSESNGGASSGGNDGAGAATSEPSPNNSEKTKTEG